MPALEVIATADCKRRGEYAELCRIEWQAGPATYRLCVFERRTGRKHAMLDVWDGGLPTLALRFQRLTGKPVNKLTGRIGP